MTFYDQYRTNLINLQANNELVAVEVDISPVAFIDDRGNTYHHSEVTIKEDGSCFHIGTNTPLRKVKDFYNRYLQEMESIKYPTETRTLYDCSTCRTAIEYSNIVFIDKKLNMYTAWDNIDTDNEIKNKTAKVLSQYLKEQPIINKLYKSQDIYKFGNRETVSIETGKVYNHFETLISDKYRVVSVDNARNNTIQYYNDLKRMLDNLTKEHFALVRDNVRITNNSHIDKLDKIESFYKEYMEINDVDKAVWLWYNLSRMYVYSDIHSVSILSNTPIGLILNGLVEGESIEEVKGIYENSVMDVDTYNRTTRVASMSAIQQLDKDLEALGYSRDNFITGTVAEVDEVMSIWSNGDNSSTPRDEVMNRLLRASSSSKRGKQINGKPLGMKEFINTVLPEASKVEIGVSETLKHHRAVITKQTTGDKSIFSHGNMYGYMYVSGRTNAVLERVKEQSGKLDTPYGFSLAWDNFSPTQGDDLDIGLLHCDTPVNINNPVSRYNNPYKYHTVDFNNKSRWHYGMLLDVDANANKVTMEHPVENIAVKHLYDGYYYAVVHNFNRVAGNNGFQLNIRTKGVNRLYRYNKDLGHNKIVVVATWEVVNGEIVNEEIHPDLEEVNTDINNAVTEFREVTKVTVSPNYWETPKGNAHYFFHVDGLEWDKGRPIQFLHGELLSPELRNVKRVLQTLGEQNPIEEDPRGKVWYGFDTNVEEEVIFKVTDKNNKIKVYKVLVDK